MLFIDETQGIPFIRLQAAETDRWKVSKKTISSGFGGC